MVRKEGEPISPTERGQQGPNKNSPGGTNGAIQKRAHSFFFGDVSIVFKNHQRTKVLSDQLYL